jgi:hypothetical protein
MTQKQVIVSERALYQRINRKLQQQANPEILRAARSEKQAEELGEYYVVETGTAGEPRTAISSGVTYVHVNLEKFGRKLGTLKPWEKVG